MLTIAKTALYTSALALGIISADLCALPAYSQSTTADSFNFDELSAGGKGNWNFTSEDETRSIRDNLKQLKEYDISGVENFDIRLTRQNRRRWGIGRWANKGDRPYYSIDDGFYPYYFRQNRRYNY